MFPRPETLPSRMFHQTTHERLQQMRDESPHARAAETLLACLVIFHEPFNKHAVRTLAPTDMDTATRNAAFSTLRDYNLVQCVSQRRYIVPASLKPLYPINEAMRAQHWAHFSVIPGRSYDPHNRLSNYWSDIFTALPWGLENDHDKALKLCETIHERKHAPASSGYWTALLPSMHAAALRTEEPLLKAFIFQCLGQQAYADNEYERAEHWYIQAYDLCVEAGNELRQASVVLDRAALSQATKQIVQARQHYGQVIDIYRKMNYSILYIYLLLFRMEVGEKNLDEALAHFEVLAPSQQVENGHLIGQLLSQFQRYDGARHIFATTLWLSDFTGMSYWTEQLLRAWGEMEYATGNRQAGCNLCRMAALILTTLISDARSIAPLYLARLDQLKMLIIQMGCDEGEVS